MKDSATIAIVGALGRRVRALDDPDGIPPDRVERVRLERDYLLWWLTAERGVSSDALVRWALGVGKRPTTPEALETLPASARRYICHDCPLDQGDLRRCQQAYDAAPTHLQEMMQPVLDEFRAYVEARKVDA